MPLRVRCPGCDKKLHLPDTVADYEEDIGHYPRATIPNSALPREKRLSFMVALLPYTHWGDRFSRTDQGKEAYRRVDLTKAWDDEVHAEVFKQFRKTYGCPAQNRTHGEKGYGLAHFAGNGGVGPDGLDATNADEYLRQSA